MNPYQQPKEKFDYYWKTYYPKTFTGETKAEAQSEAFSRMPEAEKAAFVEASIFQAKDANEVQMTISNAEKVISSSLKIAAEDKPKLLEMLKTQVNTGHGIRTEDKVVEKVAKETGVAFERDDTMYVIPLCVIGETKFFLRGKIDRIQEENGELVLVEVKSRVKKLFKQLRNYEEVQVQTYLRMLPGNIKRAKLIEECNGESYTIEIERNEELWSKTIEPRLVQFCASLRESMESGVAFEEKEK